MTWWHGASRTYSFSDLPLCRSWKQPHCTVASLSNFKWSLSESLVILWLVQDDQLLLRRKWPFKCMLFYFSSVNNNGHTKPRWMTSMELNYGSLSAGTGAVATEADFVLYLWRVKHENSVLLTSNLASQIQHIPLKLTNTSCTPLCRSQRSRVSMMISIKRLFVAI